MVDQPLHEKIEAYLLGQLEPAEAAAFKREIENNPQLAEEVELHRLILPVSDRLEEIDLHEDFARWRKEMEVETEPPPALPGRARNNRFLLLVALALVLCAGALLLWRVTQDRTETEGAERRRTEQTPPATQQENNQRPNEPAEAVQPAAPAPKTAPPTSGGKPPVAAAPEPEYVQWADEGLIAYADDMLGSFRARGGQGDLPGEALIEQADIAIQRRQYREAAALLRSVSPDDEMWYSKSLEFLAFVCFKRRQYDEAVNTYKKYREYNRNTDKTDWDLCLFYLADYPQYKKELNALLDGILSDPKHPKYKAATQLKARMDAGGLQ